MCQWDMVVPSQQTESRQMTDLKREETVQLNLIMLQTKYQINIAYTILEIFDVI